MFVLSYLPYRKQVFELERGTSLDPPPHTMSCIWKKISLHTANIQKYWAESSATKWTRLSLDKQPLTQTSSFWHLLRRQSDSSRRCTAKAVRVREKNSKSVFLIPTSHGVLEKWNFKEKVFKTPTKQGGVRGTAFSVLPLALKATFPHCHRLTYPERSKNNLGGINILQEVRVTFTLRTLQTSWLKDTVRGHHLQAIHSCTSDKMLVLFSLKQTMKVIRFCKFVNPTRAILTFSEQE